MRSPAIVALINQDKADVEQLEIQQTPTFYINGQPLTEYDFDRFDEQVHEALGN